MGSLVYQVPGAPSVIDACLLRWSVIDDRTARRLLSVDRVDPHACTCAVRFDHLAIGAVLTERRVPRDERMKP